MLPTIRSHGVVLPIKIDTLPDQGWMSISVITIVSLGIRTRVVFSKLRRYSCTNKPSVE